MSLNPTAEDIGRRVLYRGYGGEIEEGTLMSFNHAYVFVRFGTSQTPQACSDDERLEWIWSSRP